MTSRMHGDLYKEKVHPPPSPNSTTPTTGATIIRSGLHISMRNTKDKTMKLSVKQNLANLLLVPQLINLLPLPHQSLFSMKPYLKLRWQQFARSKVHDREDQGNRYQGYLRNGVNNSFMTQQKYSSCYCTTSSITLSLLIFFQQTYLLCYEQQLSLSVTYPQLRMVN